MIDVWFSAPIAPHAKGRPRVATVGGQARAYTPAPTAKWERAFARLARPHRPDEKIDQPVRVDILAVRARPQKYNRKRDWPGLLWAAARPDADNYRKAVLDALSEFWRDDCLVVAGETWPVYAEIGGEPRTEVWIRSAPETPEVFPALNTFLGRRGFGSSNDEGTGNT